MVSANPIGRLSEPVRRQCGRYAPAQHSDRWLLLSGRQPFGGLASVFPWREQRHQIVGQPVEVNGQKATCPVSIGIAYGTTDHETPEEVIRDANTAMYHAKASGAGKYALFEPSMHEAVLSRWRLENDLRHAIERDELRVVYQPVIDTKTGQVVEVEALMRWKH